MATETATIINLVNTVLGAGMLALPFAFRAQGIVLSLFSIVFGAVMTGTGLALLAYASGFLPQGTASFFQVARITYPSLAVVFDIAIGLKCFGVCVSYLVIVGDLMPNVTAYFGWDTSRGLWLFVAMLVVTPFSFQRSLESLKTVSIVALSSVVYLVIIVVGHYLVGDTLSQKGPVAVFKPKGTTDVISTVPIIVFAFTCAQNMFAAVNELTIAASKDRFRSLLGISATTVLISAVIYITVGLAGYLSFGDNVGDNVISMYSQSVWSTLGRFAIVVLVVFSYPLMCHPSRASIINVWDAYKHRHVSNHNGNGGSSHHLSNETAAEAAAGVYTPLLAENGESDVLPSPTTTPSTTTTTPPVGAQNTTHIVVTSTILVLTYFLASTLNSLELVLSFVGATGATAVSFILPGLFGYCLASSNRTNALVDLSARQKTTVKAISLFLFVYGTVVAVLAIGVNVYRLTSQ